MWPKSVLYHNRFIPLVYIYNANCTFFPNISQTYEKYNILQGGYFHEQLKHKHSLRKTQENSQPC